MASHLSFSLATLSSWRGHLFPCFDFRTPEWTKTRRQVATAESAPATSDNTSNHPKKNTKTCIVSFEVNNVYKPAQRNTPEKSNVLTCRTVQLQVFRHLSTQKLVAKKSPKISLQGAKLQTSRDTSSWRGLSTKRSCIHSWLEKRPWNVRNRFPKQHKNDFWVFFLEAAGDQISTEGYNILRPFRGQLTLWPFQALGKIHSFIPSCRTSNVERGRWPFCRARWTIRSRSLTRLTTQPPTYPPWSIDFVDFPNDDPWLFVEEPPVKNLIQPFIKPIFFMNMKGTTIFLLTLAACLHNRTFKRR